MAAVISIIGSATSSGHGDLRARLVAEGLIQLIIENSKEA
jgi:hypothetical protein